MITDFTLWLNACEIDSDGEAEQLYEVVKNASIEIGSNVDDIYSCKVANGAYHVSCSHVDGKLLLASESARQAFLQTLRKQYSFL